MDVVTQPPRSAGRDPGPADTLEDDLARWGKVIILETRGRRSGRPRRVPVGFLEAEGGALLVAAADEDTHWALNLLAEPRCTVEREGIRLEHEAILLEEEAHHATVTALIMKYGAPAERLGAGPAFRLAPGAGPAHT